MADITFSCPRCKEGLEAPLDMAGISTTCPTCKHNFKIPMHSLASSRRSISQKVNSAYILIPIVGVLLLSLGAFMYRGVSSTKPQALAVPNDLQASDTENAKQIDFQGLFLRCSPDEALYIISQGPEPCELVDDLVSKVSKDGSALIFHGNHRLKDANETMLLFWKDELYFAACTFLFESEYQAKEQYRVLHLLLSQKYGKEDHLISVWEEARWTIDNATVELLNRFSTEKLKHQVSVGIVDDQLKYIADQAELRIRAAEQGAF